MPLKFPLLHSEKPHLLQKGQTTQRWAVTRPSPTWRFTFLREACKDSSQVMPGQKYTRFLFQDVLYTDVWVHFVVLLHHDASATTSTALVSHAPHPRRPSEHFSTCHRVRRARKI